MHLRGRFLYGIRVFILLTALIASKGPAVAQTQSLAPGSVTLSATFESIGVRAKFSGDSNANATATIKFRSSQEVAWHDAYPPFIDRRATIGGVANPYAFEARGSIVGLTSNTVYQVQVTWADPDGVSGAQPGVATVTTLSYTPPTGGSTITVTDSASLASALSSVSPGQTIHLNPGTYNAFTVNRSGDSGAWIIIEGDPALTSIVTGMGDNPNIRVNANFIILQKLTLSASDFYGIIIGPSQHHLFIQDNTLQDVSHLCAEGPTTTHYGDTGIYVGNGATNVYILRNTILSTSLAGCVQSIPYNGPGAGIGWTNATTLVIDRNTVIGSFRDAISADDDRAGVDVDVSRNRVSGYVDDGIESKGYNVNTRLWGNNITATNADTCIAGNTNDPRVPYGPLYIFRNVCRTSGSALSGGGSVFKITPGAPMYIFHNSMDSSLSAVPNWDLFSMSGNNGPVVIFNNITKSSGSIFGGTSSEALTTDYNLGTSESAWAYSWNGSTTYDTFAAFRTGTGQEAHGLNVDPLFADTGLRIGAISPAVDKGVILPNFNTLDSAWPYSGSAPDIGAFELRTLPAQAPAAPTNLRIQ